MNREFRAIDGILLSIILFSSAYIIWNQTTGRVTNNRDVNDSGQLVPVINVPRPSLNEQAVRMAKWRPVGSELAAAYKENGVLPISETPICSRSKLYEAEAVAVEREDVVEAVKKGKIDIYLGDRASRCYRVGKKLRLVLFDRTNETAPFALMKGRVTIRQIYHSSVEKIPDLVFESLGAAKAEHSRFFPGADPETVLQISDYETDTSSTESLQVLPRTEKISFEEVANIKGRFKKVVIFDLRTVPKQPLDGARPFKVDLGPEVNGKSIFEVPRKALLESAKFNAAELLGQMGSESLQTAFIFVTSSGNDLRMAALSVELHRARLGALYWLVLN
jgi:hypothetical protein